MFSTALALVEKYTLPVIYSRRLLSGQVQSGCGTFIVVNRDGWILTAGHILSELTLINEHLKEYGEYERQKQEILNDPRLTGKQKNKHIGRLPRKPEWIRNQAVLWGGFQSQLADVSVDPVADLAVGRLHPFDPSWIQGFPILKDPSQPMLIGSSLCRLGYPLHQIDATFDEHTGLFSLAPGVLPVPRFPNDGLYTRNVVVASPDGKRQANFIETSTPGLRGQSGGPIFDRHGHIWAIQSRTQSLPLGFVPKVKIGNREVEEHQFIHVGWGVHVAEAIRVLRDHNVAFQTSSTP
jgi:hypothetical protein